MILGLHKGTFTLPIPTLKKSKVKSLFVPESKKNAMSLENENREQKLE